MKKNVTQILMLLLVVTMLPYWLQAQNVTQYGFAETSGTFTALSGATTSSATGDDGVQNVAIGFPFYYEGTSYTNVVISTNGGIKFGDGATAWSSAWTNTMSNTYAQPVVGALWDDNYQQNGPVSYQLAGSAPNRTFTIEWNSLAIGGSGSSSNPTATFQIKLYETSNNIQIIYGTVNALSTTTASIGLVGLASFLSVAPGFPATTSSTTSPSITSNTGLSVGTTYTFTAPACPVSGPATQASGIVAAAPTVSSLSISWGAGSGNTRIVKINTTNSFTDLVNGTPPPTANTVYAGGEQVIYVGTGSTSSVVTGLTGGTAYWFKVYEASSCNGISYYNNSNASDNPKALNTLSTLTYDVTRTTNTGYSSIFNRGAVQYFNNIGTYDDGTSIAFPIGFNFTYQGQIATQFRACINGWMTLDPNSSATTYPNAITVNTSDRKAILAPYWDDLVIQGSLASNQNICMGYELSGNAPYRILTVEWREMEKYLYPGPSLNFQVKLYESSNNIEFAYGNMSAFDGSKDVAFTYSLGLTSFTVGTLGAGDVICQQNSNTKIFAATAQNNLNLPPVCYSSLLFNPGIYNVGFFNPPPANENCNTAELLLVSAVAPTEFCQIYQPGSSADGSAPSCSASGNPDDDVWFSFVPDISGTVTLNVKPAGGYDPVVQLYSGSCGALTSLSCVNAITNPTSSGANNTATSVSENLIQAGLTAGTTYYARVFHAGTGGFGNSFDNGSSFAPTATPQESGFAISVFVQPDPPANDNCAGAIALTVDGFCSPINGSTTGATASPQALCVAGTNADDDVWFKFVQPNAPGTTFTLQVQSAPGFDAVVEIFNAGATGNCTSMTSLSCFNNTGSGSLETYTSTSLVSGNTYYVRVYHKVGGAGSANFTICAFTDCPVPTAVTPSAVTTTTAAVSWTGTGNFIVEYGPAGFTPGTGLTTGGGTILNNGNAISITTSGTIQNISGLMAATAYDIYVRRQCPLGTFSTNVKAVFSTCISAAQCYCQPASSPSSSDYIADVVVSGTTLSNIGTTYIGTTPSIYPATGNTTAILMKSYPYKLNVKSNATSIVSVWIDYNQNGVFDATEWTQVSASTTANVAASVQITIPTTALSGVTMMRVRSRGTGSPNGSGDACTAFFTGETEDYTITIVDAAIAPTVSSCTPSETLQTNGAYQNNVWIPLITTTGQVVAAVNANGQNIGDITAEYYTSASQRYDATGQAYLNRNWAISSAGTFSNPVSVRLYFTDAEFSALNAISGQPLAMQKITHIPAATCTPAFNAPAFTPNLITQTGNASFGVANSYIQFNTSSFSGFFVNGGALLLPIELRAFAATEKGKKNEITWETASEKNLRVFQLERSSDAKNWTKVVEVTPNQAKSYSTEDTQPFALTYYRLISVDTDGQTMVSKIVSVERRTGKLNIANVFPNPTNGILNINFENIETGIVQLFVTDLLGRQILTSSIEATEGMNTTNLDVSNIAAGTYFITLDNGVSKITKRVVKQ